MKTFLYLLVTMLMIGTAAFFLRKKMNVNPPIKILATDYEGNLPLNKLKVPEGFRVGVYAEGVTNARSMTYSKNGTLYVGTRSKGNVYALRDENNDGVAEKMFTLYTGGNMPNGVALKDGDLYVAEVNRILKWSDIENKLENPGEPEVVYDQYPTEKHHGWKYIAFGPDGKLYVPVGAPCNICESDDPIFNTITRLDVTTGLREIVHKGIRNTVGFDWHPTTGHLWFTDNGRDMLGDDIPACELNVAKKDGNHYGYPYCHQGDLPDPEFGDKRPCNAFVAPAQNLGPHTAPLGLAFGLESSMLPDSYKNKVFMAEHGSWNRSKKIGYRITMVDVDEEGNATNYQPFIDGWLNSDTDDVWGRPVDIEYLPDGSMLISDYFADAIYRVSYEGL